MAVPFHLPEGGNDDIASSSAGTSGASSPSSSVSSSSSSSGSSSGASTSSGASDGASSIASQSPNTTTSATQTPMQSPHTMPTDQVLIALCEWYQQHQHQRQNNYNVGTTGPQIFQYPPPPSPSCYAVGDVFFPPLHPHMPPHRTQHSSFSYDEEQSYYRQTYPAPSTPQPMPPQPLAPQSAPPLRYSHSYPQQSPHLHHHAAASVYGAHNPSHPVTYYATYTPPPTPNNNSNGTMCASTSSLAAATFGPRPGHGPGLSSTPLGPKMRLQRTQSDAARRKRLTSTGEDEREYQSDHETSWDEFDDRYDNFTAGRERLQEFSGRIPPRKKKTNNAGSGSGSSSSIGNLNPSEGANSNESSGCGKQREQRERAEQKNQQSFTWPTVVTVFVLAIGCVFFAAR